MKKHHCILCKKELKLGEEKFCYQCVKYRSLKARFKALQEHYKISYSKYERKGIKVNPHNYKKTKRRSRRNPITYFFK